MENIPGPRHRQSAGRCCPQSRTDYPACGVLQTSLLPRSVLPVSRHLREVCIRGSCRRLILQKEPCPQPRKAPGPASRKQRQCPVYAARMDVPADGIPYGAASKGRPPGKSRGVPVPHIVQAPYAPWTARNGHGLVFSDLPGQYSFLQNRGK